MVLLEKDSWAEQPNEAAQKCFPSSRPRCCAQGERGSSAHPGPRTLKGTAGQRGGCRLLREGFPVPSAPAQREEEAPACPTPQLASAPSTPGNFCLIATFFPRPKTANRVALIFFFLYFKIRFFKVRFEEKITSSRSPSTSLCLPQTPGQNRDEFRENDNVISDQLQPARPPRTGQLGSWNHGDFKSLP